MTTSQDALYFDPLRPVPVWVGVASQGADGFYCSHFAVVHWDGGQRTYRVMIRYGCSKEPAHRAVFAYIEAHPELSFRDCMVNPPPSFEELIPAERASERVADHAQPNYAALRRVLDAALAQSSEGKGKVRHANGLDFGQQPIMRNSRICGIGGPIQQVLKKSEEAIGMHQRGEDEAAKAELLGVIVYAAAAYLILDEQGR